MEIVKEAIAGTLESCDIQIMLMESIGGGIEIELKSNVEKQFGRRIKQVITETLGKYGVENVKVVANDKGALDCTIKARVECALFRACEMNESLDWKVID